MRFTCGLPPLGCQLVESSAQSSRACHPNPKEQEAVSARSGAPRAVPKRTREPGTKAALCAHSLSCRRARTALADSHQGQGPATGYRMMDTRVVLLRSDQADPSDFKEMEDIVDRFATASDAWEPLFGGRICSSVGEGTGLMLLDRARGLPWEEGSGWPGRRRCPALGVRAESRRLGFDLKNRSSTSTYDGPSGFWGGASAPGMLRPGAWMLGLTDVFIRWTVSAGVGVSLSLGAPSSAGAGIGWVLGVNRRGTGSDAGAGAGMREGAACAEAALGEGLPALAWVGGAWG
mmetsp:Transcript_69175/g.122155  ORF Transcript_69175/g.122155 Transcript_69175/m.122155 type:complete len:290 (+) Transcript_69175:919-1788(+)